MKLSVLTTLFVLGSMPVWACEVCQKQQPKMLRGVTHGAGPESQWDYVIIVVAVAVVLGTLARSVYFLLRPGETETTHIKHTVLNPMPYE